jgi:hypothetical protein
LVKIEPAVNLDCEPTQVIRNILHGSGSVSGVARDCNQWSGECDFMPSCGHIDDG